MQNNNNDAKKIIPDPLLFIHTVTTPILSNGSQRYYDSRNPELSKKDKKVGINFKSNKIIDINNNNEKSILINKLNNLIQMFNQNQVIPTIIETKYNQSFEGIPCKVENNILFLNQNTNCIKIPLEDILDVIILKI